MKTTTVIALVSGALLGLLTTQALADPHTYRGSFTFTFTNLEQRQGEEYDIWYPTSSIPGLAVGKTFLGAYGYQSETIDGAFGEEADNYLGFESFYAHSINQTGPFPPLNFDVLAGTLIVSGGHLVAAHDLGSEPNEYVFVADLHSFGYWPNPGSYALYRGSGTMSWDDPYRVPDSGGLTAFSLTVAALMAASRASSRIRRQP